MNFTFSTEIHAGCQPLEYNIIIQVAFLKSGSIQVYQEILYQNVLKATKKIFPQLIQTRKFES